MKTTINRPPDDMTMQELATRCRLYRKFGDTAEAEQIEPEQNEKPLHIQAVEILGHIHNCDYGLAESKAMILRDQLQKGDWTLGARTETELADGGFVRMYCDGAIDNVHISNIALSAEQNKFMYDRSVERVDTDDRATLLEILQIVNRLNGSDARKDVRAIKSMKSVDGLITKWGAQPNEDTTSPEERTCAFCGHDTPSMICGGSWFCDRKCANNHTDKDVLIKDLEAKTRSIKNSWFISCDDVHEIGAELKSMKSDRDSWEQEAHRLIERLSECAILIEELKDKNIEDLKELDECNERCTKLGSHNMQITANLLDRKKLIDGLRETIENFKIIETQETDRLHKTILDMDVTISDLMDNDKRINGFLDEYRVTVDNRDKTIEELSAMVEAKTKSNQTIIHDKNTIIDEKDKMLEKYRREIVGLRDMHDAVWGKVRALEAELSARKEDSAVLMEVVEIIKDDTIPNSKVPCVIFNLVKDYLDDPGAMEKR